MYRKYFFLILFFYFFFSSLVNGQKQSMQVFYETGTTKCLYFQDAINHHDTIVGFVNNINYNDIFELRRIDQSGNTVLKKTFKVYNSTMAQTCGTGKTWVFSPQMFYLSMDSAYLLIASLSENYGTCPQVNNLVLLLKLNSDLDTIWHMEYSLTRATNVKSSCLIQDSSLFVIGHHSIVKLKTANGDTIWSKSISGANFSSDIFSSVTPSINDSAILVCGYATINNKKHGTISKISGSGNCLWSKSYEDSLNSQYFHTIERTNDSSYIVSSILNPNTPQVKYAILKIDDTGNCLWKLNFLGSPIVLSLSSFFNSKDNSYLFLYNGYDSIAQKNAYFILNIDQAGQCINNQSFIEPGGTCTAHNINRIFDTGTGGYVLLRDFYINLDSLFSNCYFYNYPKPPVGLTSESADTFSFTFSGIPSNWQWNYNLNRNTIINSSLNSYVWLDSCIASPSGFQEMNENNILVYPNPVKDALQFKSPINIINRIVIRDVFGKALYRSETGEYGNLVTIDCHQWMNGIYFFEIVAGDTQRLTGKFMVMN